MLGQCHYFQMKRFVDDTKRDMEVFLNYNGDKAPILSCIHSLSIPRRIGLFCGAVVARYSKVRLYWKLLDDLVGPQDFHLFQEKRYPIFQALFWETYTRISGDKPTFGLQLLHDLTNDFVHAIANDDADELREVLALPGHTVNDSISIPHLSLRLISWAAFFGSFKVFRFLLVNGAETKLENGPMVFAIASGNEEMIQLLIDKDLHFEDDAIDAAVRFHQMKILEWILEQRYIKPKVPLNTIVDSMNFSALQYFLENEYQILGKEALDIILVSMYHDVFPIYFYAMKLSESCIDYSLRMLGKFCIQYDLVDFVEYYLENYRHMTVIDQYLLPYVASPKMKDLFRKYGYKVNNSIDVKYFNEAIDKNDMAQIQIIAHESRVKINEFREITPLQAATRKGSLQVIEFLLSQGAVYDDSFNNPIPFSFEQRDCRIFKLFYELGCPIPESCKPPLVSATKAKNIPLITTLIEFGFDVNESLPNGWNALCSAVDLDDIELVKFLIENGADVHSTLIYSKKTILDLVKSDEVRALLVVEQVKAIHTSISPHHNEIEVPRTSYCD